ncbi:MAG: hypothetical protein WB676_04750 [Bryobacteraceae bacterium]
MQFETLPVSMIHIDETGKMEQAFPDTSNQGQLKNTLLSKLYPKIRVATVEIPTEIMDDYAEAQVEGALSRVVLHGTRYKLAGASGSAKNGKFYAVDEQYEKAIAQRFQFWPQAAITYFGILVSDCKVVIEEPNSRILVVKEGSFGTNDCRGWISESLFAKLQLPPGRFYQFRLAFDQTQAKGCFKVMDDDVASALNADIVIPESCVKPEMKLSPLQVLQNMVCDGVRFKGRAVLGIRDWSRNLEFKSSYTLVEHAPLESIMTEIVPQAIEEVKKLVDAALGGNYDALFQLLGTAAHQREQEELEGLEHTSYENSLVEALLKADGSGGYLVKHPYIRQKLGSLLARWTFKVCTGGGFRMPAFALADDGFLFLRGSRLVFGSDWIPRERTIAEVSCRRGLVVRYPIRMKEDLLPVEPLALSELATIFERTLRANGAQLTSEEAVWLLERQIRLPGTLVLHSRKAKENGGDFDFDLVAFLEGSGFPKFVQSRFDLTDPYVVTKDKREKSKSAYFNFHRVAMKARGNEIGRITDLKTSCLAAGRRDLAYKLVKELQNALDSLKHGTGIDRELVNKIRNEVKPAPWLAFKKAKCVNDFPIALDTLSTDVIGRMYHLLRPHIDDLFTAVLPLQEFAGLVAGNPYTEDMADECRRVNRMFACIVRTHIAEAQKYAALVAQARAVVEAAKTAAPKLGDKASQKAKENARKSRDAAYAQLRRASAAARNAEERRKEEMKRLADWIRAWGAGKRTNRRGWCQALHDRTQKSTFPGSTASVLFVAFPQEVLDSVVEATGGRPIVLHMPEEPDGEIVFDTEGNVFRVEAYQDGAGSAGEKYVFLFRITEEGKVITSDGRLVDRVQPFAMKEGKGEIRDGQVILTDLRQKPSVKGIGMTLISSEEGNG